MNALFGTQRDQIILIEQGRSRPDNAHVTTQNTPELWQLIQARFTKKIANRSEPTIWIAKQMGGDGWGVDAHGTKFWHFEDFVVATNPVGPVENGAGGRELDQQGHEQHGDAEGKAGNGCHSKIKYALQGNISSSVVFIDIKVIKVLRF